MKLYIAGPDREFHAFHQAAVRLRSEGHVVFSPVESDEELRGQKIYLEGENACRETGIEDAYFLFTEAEGIALLPGWQTSKRADAAFAIALFLNLEFRHLT